MSGGQLVHLLQLNLLGVTIVQATGEIIKGKQEGAVERHKAVNGSWGSGGSIGLGWGVNNLSGLRSPTHGHKARATRTAYISTGPILCLSSASQAFDSSAGTIPEKNSFLLEGRTKTPPMVWTPFSLAPSVKTSAGEGVSKQGIVLGAPLVSLSAKSLKECVASEDNLELRSRFLTASRTHAMASLPDLPMT